MEARNGSPLLVSPSACQVPHKRNGEATNQDMLRRAVAVIALGAALVSSNSVHADELCSITPGSYAAAKQSHPQLAFALNEMEKYSIATWYTDRGGDYAATARALVATCPESSRLSVVVYGLPNKDCGAGYSTGGAVKDAADYERFLSTLTSTIGSRKVLYVLEPDAVGLLAGGGCGEQAGYRENLKTAIRMLSGNPNAEIYLDVGYWTLQSTASAVGGVFKSLVGAGRVKGIALNTSNYRSNAELSSLCWNFQNAIGNAGYHCVVDTSRNFVTPTSSEWCNVRSAGIGSPPTSNTGFWNLDYFMWIKVPGESDGKCNTGGHTSESMVGPDAGAFFAEHFKLMWNQGYFANKLNFRKIGSGESTTCAASGHSCGNDAVGAGCCATAGEYCQPWNPGYYQCRPEPLLCGIQQVGVDFYGDDLATHYGILPEQCCAQCADTDGCKAYTFVNDNRGGTSACYLKRGTGAKRSVVGAVSAEVISPKVACSTAQGAVCGTSQGTHCCPSGSYCQPWNSGYYQCIQRPAKCSLQLTNIDFYGNDLGVVYSGSPAECCDKCTQTAGCIAYTFVNYNSDGRTACYLKSGTGVKRTTVGAVSGVVNQVD